LNTILPSRHRHTRRVRRLTPLCGLSITLVEHKQRAKRGDSSRRFTVNISAKPSRKLAAALGSPCSSHCACFSSLAIPSFAGSRKADRTADFTWSFSFSGKYPVTFSSCRVGRWRGNDRNGESQCPAAFALAPVPHSVPWSRFQHPLIEPYVKFSLIRLSGSLPPSAFSSCAQYGPGSRTDPPLSSRPGAS